MTTYLMVGGEYPSDYRVDAILEGPETVDFIALHRLYRTSVHGRDESFTAWLCANYGFRSVEYEEQHTNPQVWDRERGCFVYPEELTTRKGSTNAP